MRVLKVPATPALVLAAAALAGCGTRGEEPFVPPPPPVTTWAPNVVTVTQNPNIRLATPNAIAGGRDDVGSMHLVWEDDRILRHGFVSLSQTQWTLRTIPTVNSSATVRRPVLAYPSGAVFIVAWLEQLGATNRIVVSRSNDHGANWDTPITLSLGTNVVSSPVIYGYRRSNNSLGAVVAWTDQSVGPGRVISAMWRGTGWTLADWTTPTAISTNTTAPAQGVALAGQGENVVAVWADPRGAIAGTGIFMSRSTTGGQTWGSDALIGIPIGTSGSGTEPSVAVEVDGDIYIAWNASQQVRATRSSDNGLNFSTPRTLGTGFAPVVVTGDNDRVAVAWTNASSLPDESTHHVQLALSLDDLATVEGPNAMPGAASILSRTAVRAFLSGAALDMIWLDVSGGTRTVQHRTAALP